MMNICEMEKQVKELRQLQALIKEAQAEAEAIKDSLKASMGSLEAVQVGEYHHHITWKDIKTSRSDTEAIRSAFPDIAREFTRVIITKRFCIV